MRAPDQEMADRADDDHPTFATERLPMDVSTATDRIRDSVNSVTATATDEGVKVRALDGMLLAVVTEESDDEGAALHYRTAPPSEPATLKAQRLRRTLGRTAD